MKFLISLVILTFSLIQSLRLSNNKYMKIRIQTLLKSTISSAKASESGASMQIENANLSIGNNDIISGINWTIMPKERWALVGKNGAGKRYIFHIYYLIKYCILFSYDNFHILLTY